MTRTNISHRGGRKCTNVQKNERGDPQAQNATKCTKLENFSTKGHGWDQTLRACVTVKQSIQGDANGPPLQKTMYSRGCWPIFVDTAVAEGPCPHSREWRCARNDMEEDANKHTRSEDGKGTQKRIAGGQAQPSIKCLLTDAFQVSSRHDLKQAALLLWNGHCVGICRASRKIKKQHQTVSQ